MKALVKKKPGEGLWLEDVAKPEIGINDVLIKITKTSICGTDVHIYNWDEWAQKTIKPPMTIGHEFVGVIQEVGSNVHDFHPGDLVSGEGHVVCGRCRNCLAGRRHLCKAPTGIGVNRNGAFAEYLSIPVTNAWYCDRDIPQEVLSCFDPLGNAAHTALSFDLVGEDVLITGAGPIGVMAGAIAKKAGARHVVITDVNPYRLDLARKMGVTRAIDVRSETVEDVTKELDMHEGFDVGFEMSGNPDALRSLLKNMCHGGKICLLGILPQTSIDWDYVVFNGLTIKGIYGREMYETWYKVTMMIKCGLDITPLITHKFHYTEFMKGFDVMRSGNSGKVVLDWTE
ncbi:MAG: L-threonine 3-dehydrogenase [Sedimentisphaerales bacterium]|nr:L-threonine 3-dehydrogenase [Sedimentisphaerales bacterium]